MNGIDIRGWIDYLDGEIKKLEKELEGKSIELTPEEKDFIKKVGININD